MYSKFTFNTNFLHKQTYRIRNQFPRNIDDFEKQFFKSMRKQPKNQIFPSAL